MLDTSNLSARLDELNDILDNINIIDEEINNIDETIVALRQENNLDEIEELKEDRDNLNHDRYSYYSDYDVDEHHELESLKTNITGWGYITLIPENEIDDYLKETINDCEELNNLPSYIIIDWESTLNNLRMDYSCVDYEGTEYWFLSY